MKRLKCIISYDGSDFNGFQVQPNGRTVQGEIEKSLKKLHKGEVIKIQASGRTDTGVHAYGQVIHFDTPLDIPIERWAVALNTLFPNDIVVKEVFHMNSEFHARYDVIKKEYRYRLFYGSIPDVFRRAYVFEYPYKLNIDDMKCAIEYLRGTHDFTSFCSTKTDKENKVRTIYEAEIIQENDELIFRFVGDGFLYNMVRIMIGTLLKVSQGKLSPNDIPVILEAKDRKKAAPTAPGHGLYLWKVYY